MRQKILEELQVIAFARATDYVGIQGDQLVVKDTDSLPQDAGAAIASIERSTTGLKVKFYDKLKALELLGKCYGLFDAGVDSGQDNGLLQAVLEASRGEDDGVERNG